MTRRSRTSLVAVLPLLILSGCASTPTTVEPTYEDKRARTLKLEDERSAGGGELVARLGEPEAALRARAALTLGRLGDPDAAPSLTALLADPEEFVRARAAFALGLLRGSLPEPTLTALRAALDDDSARVRGRAAETLARKLGAGAAEPIAGSLLEHLPQGPEPHDWTEPIVVSERQPPHLDLRLGLFALAELESLRWSWSVLATEGSTPRFIWWPAAWTTSALEGEELAPLLHFYAGSPDPTLRLYGARGLGGTSIEQAGNALRLLMFDPNEKVRIEAIGSVARLGMDALVPDLVSQLGEDTRYVQVEVLKALTVLGGVPSLDPLLDLVADESAWMRAWALRAIARQDPESFWLLLSGLGSDPEWRVRREIAETLGRMEGSRPRALLLTMAERDEDARVRARALRWLARRGTEGVSGLAIDKLSSTAASERVAAAEALAELGAGDAFAPVTQAFLGEEAPWARPALLDALAEIDLEAAAEVAREALDDTEYLVRRKAASILFRAGETADVRPRPSERSVEDYASVATAPYSPQAFVTTSKGSLEVELFIGDAPLTVANFIELARADFFDGLPFYDVVPNGAVRSGDPEGDGTGGPGYAIRSEINERPLVRGTLAMDDAEKDSTGSRFFITHLPRPELEGRYTVFGHVIRGMEVVDRLEPGDVVEDVVIWDGITSPYTESD